MYVVVFVYGYGYGYGDVRIGKEEVIDVKWI